MTGPTLDPWQYRLAAEPADGARPLGGLWLTVGPGLPVCEVRDAAGGGVGVLLGFAIDLDARGPVGEIWTAPGRFAVGGEPDAFVTAARRSLAGRFLWIFAAGGELRVYPDSSAQVPCVYDPQARLAGSTAHALLDEAEYEARFDRGLYSRLGVEGEGWFPAGLTAHRGLFRLLPDHVLDLGSWTVRRTWPGATLEEVADPAASVDEIVGIVRAQLEASLSGPKRVALALTAGHETRMLLACARPWIDRIDFVTVSGGDRHMIDTVVARRIAADFRLTHIALPRVEASAEERQRFIRRGGHCNADSNAEYHPSVWPLANSHVLFGGAGGEIARAFFWRPADTSDGEFGAATLNGRFGLPAVPEVIAALGAWLEDLPLGDALQRLDVAYIEHRDGAWYAVQFCSDPTLVRLAPLLTDRAVDLMIRLPAEWKRGSRMSDEVIARHWPELARYPYNSLGPLRDLMLRLRRAIDDPRVVLKKLRKMTS